MDASDSRPRRRTVIRGFAAPNPRKSRSTLQQSRRLRRGLLVDALAHFRRQPALIARRVKGRNGKEIRLPYGQARDRVAAGQAHHEGRARIAVELSLIHISEPTRQAEISYAVFCL